MMHAFSNMLATQPDFKHLSTPLFQPGFCSSNILLEISKIPSPPTWSLPLAIISNLPQNVPCSPIWNLPSTMGPNLLPNTSSLPISNLPCSVDPSIPFLHIPYLFTYICGLLLLVIIRNIPHNNALKTDIYLDNSDNYHNNLKYVKHSGTLIKEHLLPGMESLMYIMTDLTFKLEFIDVNILNILMLKVIMFEFWSSWYKPIISVSSGFTPINKPLTTSGLSVPTSHTSSSSNKRKDRSSSPNIGGGTNPVPTIEAKRQRKEAQVRVEMQYLGLRSGHGVYVYDTLDHMCVKLGQLFYRKTMLDYNNNGVLIRCIRFEQDNRRVNPDNYVEVVYNGRTGVWVQPKFTASATRLLNIEVTNNGLPVVISGNRMFLTR